VAVTHDALAVGATGNDVTVGGLRVYRLLWKHDGTPDRAMYLSALPFQNVVLRTEPYMPYEYMARGYAVPAIGVDLTSSEIVLLFFPSALSHMCDLWTVSWHRQCVVSVALV
jgi:hypothetical protein